jgi:hypothetical protein
MLHVDPSLAKATVESHLFAVQSHIQIEIVLDNDPLPNVLLCLPVTILEPPKIMGTVQAFDDSWMRKSELKPVLQASKTLHSIESSVLSLTVPFDEAVLYNTPPSSPEHDDDSKSERILYSGKYGRRSSAQEKLEDLMSLIKNVRVEDVEEEKEETEVMEERVCQSFDVPRGEYFRQVFLTNF